MSVTGQSGFSFFRSNLKNAWRNDRRYVLRSLTAWVLFGAIIIVFIFWGLTPHHAGVAQGGAAAQVNGKTVSIAEFSQQVEMMSRDPRFAQLQQFGGDFARQMIRQQALQALIDQELLGFNLNLLGLYTPDGQIRDSIMDIPAFQEGGRFSQTRYLGYLQSSQQEAGEFEERLRREISVGRVAKTFSTALRPLPLEDERLKAVSDHKINVDVVSVPTEKLVIPETIPQAETKVFLAKPDSAARIKTYYDTHKTEFSVPEKAKVRHILVRAQKTDAAAVEKAKATAEQILADLKKGADFANTAKQKSEDPGSKTNGGLIDYFARGAMVPEFEAFAFSAKPGEMSGLVQSDFGFHIIRLEDRKAGSDKSLEAAQDDIAEILIAQDRTRTEIEGLEAALAAGKADVVQVFLTKYKLAWGESGPFALDADTLPKFGGGDQAVSAAFQLNKDKPLATKLVRQGPQALLLRFREVTKTAAKPADKKGEPSPELEAETKASRRTEQVFGQWIDGLRKEAKISVNPEVAGNKGGGAGGGSPQ